MNFGDASVSPRRNWEYLTPAEQKQFELDDATRRAIDHATNSLKRSPAWHDRSVRFEMQQELNQGGR